MPKRRSKRLICCKCRNVIIYPLIYAKKENRCYRCGGILIDKSSDKEVKTNGRKKNVC